MTNPKDPWGQRPGDAPTEHLGPPGAFGHGEYPTTEQYDPWSTPPPAGATREIPALDSQWGAYEPGGQWQGEQQPQWAGAPWTGVPGQPGMPGQQPPGANPPPDPYAPPGQQPHKRNTGLWIALGLGLLALVGVVGVGAGLLLGGEEDTDTSAAGSTSTTYTLPFQATPSATQLPGLSNPGVPGLPDLGLEGLGATVGTITANDGGTLTISTMSGGEVTVRTDDATQVISLSVLRAADLPVGEMVVVQGETGTDGTIQARIIVSTALPGGGR